MNKVFSSNELFAANGQKWYTDRCTEAAFLLGGIGTGNVSVGSRGQLKDWEIFGTSGKGNYMPNTFFAIWTRMEGQNPQTKVLESKIQPPYSKSHGFVDYEVGGLPRFKHAKLKGEYPYVMISLEDETMPVSVIMEAFTPFIPLNADDSGIPAAVIRYRVTNGSESSVEVSVAGSLSNMTSLIKYDRHTWGHNQCADIGINEYREDGNLKGLFFRPKTIDDTNLYYGTMALTTTAPLVSYKRSWLSGGWWDGLQDMWDDFRTDGRLEPESVYVAQDIDITGPDQTGSLAVYAILQPGEEKVFEFLLSWHFPNRVNSWSKIMYDNVIRPEREKQKNECGCGDSCFTQQKNFTETDEYPIIKKYYAVLFKDAWHTARYTADNMERLEGDTRKFHQAFFSSTLPDYVLDAVASNITVIRSSTCFRLQDGTFLAWEGCFGDEGCCEGTCTHVWNYAQTVAFLFPELEQNMRRVEYQLETNPDGKMNFRTYQVFGMGGHDHVPAADGQLGTIVRLYREWKLSGDDDFLKALWPSAARTLDYAFVYWDRDLDCVLDTHQFNTYDIVFHGPSSMINSIFFAALKAGIEISSYFGDHERAEGYRKAFEEGSRRTDQLLWGGEYYIQKIDDVDEYRYQYGTGCLSDQIFGQTLAHIAGLGYILPEDHVKKAVKAIFDNNFLQSLEGHHNTQRTYALNDEQGLVLCTWPNGNRPRLPFPYSDEVWTGIEYQVAANLIYEGFIYEGLSVVKAVRDRHDGIRRNPWNEVECGHHYARSLASYGVYLALTGYRYDLSQGKIGFQPKIFQDDFQCFFSTGKGWGIYRRKVQAEGKISQTLECLYGVLDGVVLYE